MNALTIESRSPSLPRVTLVGTGVVGRAILRAHLSAGLPVRIVDQDRSAIDQAIAQCKQSPDFDRDRWGIYDGTFGNLPCADFVGSRQDTEAKSDLPSILIESIPERLDIKQSFFEDIQDRVDPGTILCSNTSTLRISEIAKSVRDPRRFCGMHFFMPVEDRSAVELVRGTETSESNITLASNHIRSLNKTPLVVRDSPGFIVNRLLSPYLNESLSLLCGGISAARIEAAALEYGMPMSPLELIDQIGTRTMFDAGRVYWQSFPHRVDPSPLLAGLIKSKRSGKFGGGGIYDYDESGRRSREVSETTQALIGRYRGDDVILSAQELVDRLAIPMWIEAAITLAEGTVHDAAQFDLAMHGGLGYRAGQSWLAFFQHLGGDRILDAIDRWSDHSKAMAAPDVVKAALSRSQPNDALRRLRSS